MDDKDKICINTHVSKQDYKEVVYFSVFFKNRAFTVTAVAGLIVAVVTLLQELLGFGTSKIMLYSSILILVCVITLLVSTEILIRKYIKSDKISIDSNLEIIIDNKNILYNVGSIKSSSEIPLNKLYRAYETKKYFIIFINYQESIIIRKCDMDLDSISKLKNILTQNNVLK